MLGLDNRELIVLRVGGLKGLLYFAEGRGFTGEIRKGHGGLAKEEEVDDEGVTGRGGKNETKGGLHKRVVVGGGGGQGNVKDGNLAERRSTRLEGCGAVSSRKEISRC